MMKQSTIIHWEFSENKIVHLPVNAGCISFYFWYHLSLMQVLVNYQHKSGKCNIFARSSQLQKNHVCNWVSSTCRICAHNNSTLKPVLKNFIPCYLDCSNCRQKIFCGCQLNSSFVNTVLMELLWKSLWFLFHLFRICNALTHSGIKFNFEFPFLKSI